MSPGSHSRIELADFLKSRRRHLTPGDVGLTGTGRRRASGLRREEVCMLAGVSVTWYTWLEQARDINPSRQVLDALAQTLHMSSAEYEYVLRLTGHAAERPLAHPSVTMPAHAQRLLDALGSSPAYAITEDWSIVGWNRAYEAFYPNVASTPAQHRNLLWLVFTDPYVHGLLADWETDSLHFLTQFRAEAGSRIHEPAFVALIDQLKNVSERFRQGWESHNVDHFTSTERNFEHPQVGTLTLEHHRLTLSDYPDLHLVIYTPVPATGTSEKLTALSTLAS